MKKWLRFFSHTFVLVQPLAAQALMSTSNPSIKAWYLSWVSPMNLANMVTAFRGPYMCQNNRSTLKQFFLTSSSYEYESVSYLWRSTFLSVKWAIIWKYSLDSTCKFPVTLVSPYVQGIYEVHWYAVFKGNWQYISVIKVFHQFVELDILPSSQMKRWRRRWLWAIGFFTRIPKLEK